mmetsp:Transcript_35750/g.91928  ORF Transcript_35750/g.91928 Transcript_35750/m.91928 type:complete len:264 (+) Transcript_35750:465-1256(+)
MVRAAVDEEEVHTLPEAPRLKQLPHVSKLSSSSGHQLVQACLRGENSQSAVTKELPTSKLLLLVLDRQLMRLLRDCRDRALHRPLGLGPSGTLGEESFVRERASRVDHLREVLSLLYSAAEVALEILEELPLLAIGVRVGDGRLATVRQVVPPRQPALHGVHRRPLQGAVRRVEESDGLLLLFPLQDAPLLTPPCRFISFRLLNRLILCHSSVRVEALGRGVQFHSNLHRHDALVLSALEANVEVPCLAARPVLLFEALPSRW